MEPLPSQVGTVGQGAFFACCAGGVTGPLVAGTLIGLGPFVLVLAVIGFPVGVAMGLVVRFSLNWLYRDYPRDSKNFADHCLWWAVVSFVTASLATGAPIGCLLLMPL